MNNYNNNNDYKVNNYLKNESIIYNKLEKITKNYPLEKLQNYEDEIFEENTKFKRAYIEYKRLFKFLNDNYQYFIEFRDQLEEIKSLINIAKFDESIIEELNIKIVRLQIKCGMDIRLYGTLPKLLSEINYENFVKSKKKELGDTYGK